MEDHSKIFQEDDQIEPEDEIIISYYLNMMINNRKSWPGHFLRDEEANVYNLNPWRSFNTNPYNFIFVKSRTDSCGKTDGSVTGCWRIMARDKPIKSEETGRILGFKKILKFCENDKKRPEEEEGEIIWVMEEYRLVDKWKQDQVICKIRALLRYEVTSLLAKQFSFLSKWIIPLTRRDLLPSFDLCVPNPPTDEIISYYLKMCVDARNDWPSHFLQSEQVYGAVPWMIVDADQSSVELHKGRYFFVNREESSGRTDHGCDGGCWRIMRRDRVISSKRNKEVLGFKRLFKFCVKEGEAEPVYKFWGDEKYEVNEFKVTWVMDEYRLAKKKEQGKVICRISLLFPSPLDSHFEYF
ncbi:NAC domain containing protein 24 [Raphanus sativus]|uniref:Uncharacterized protein LOC108826619 n=1 Tax=Raphanus sativus TaxID=3726 RepID=A0A6J0L6K8_RAPSA|nr:uncharacterized protein LOC108826619 [Raphanus sativus]KAJ4876980.1 NAC domain containing protein 24 [Raphanus sativus]